MHCSLLTVILIFVLFFEYCNKLPQGDNVGFVVLLNYMTSLAVSVAKMSEFPKTLLIRHLPAELEASDQEKLLKLFGAAHTRGMGNKGRMKNMAFATFASHEEASMVMRRLHQLDVLGSRLIVEYSSKKYEEFHPTELNPLTKVLSAPSGKEPTDTTPEQHNVIKTERERRQEIIDKMHAMSARWHVEYPLDQRLQYIYPSPTVTILTNIANAMAAVPRLYFQVLHLMNKMNLPAPFGLPTLPPPVPLGSACPPQPADIPAPPLPEGIDYSSSSESEIESDSDDEKAKLLSVEVASGKRVRRRERRYASRKRLRLQIQMQSQMQAITGANAAQRPSGTITQPSEMFEQSTVTSKKIEIKKITDDTAKPETVVVTNTEEECNSSSTKTVDAAVNVVEGGFGKIQPQFVDRTSDDVEADDDWQKQGFISIEDLHKGQLSEKEMLEQDVFKNYCAGEPTSRLYIKNIAKKATEKDLRYVYGRYVNWESESEKAMFYLQVLTGRMKGQAFITLPNETKAKEALDDTNGYQLHGKPLVVQFARSVKPKDKTVATSEK